MHVQKTLTDMFYLVPLKLKTGPYWIDYFANLILNLKKSRRFITFSPIVEFKSSTNT